TQYIAERLGVFRACNDPCMDGRSFAFLVCLPQVEHEFKSVVADFEVVRITTFQLTAPFALVAFRLHGDGTPVEKVWNRMRFSPRLDKIKIDADRGLLGCSRKEASLQAFSCRSNMSPLTRNWDCHRGCDTSLR